MDTIDVDKLIVNLAAERSRVLMGIKPDAKARSTWNRALQGIADSIPVEHKQKIKDLFMEVTI